MEACSFLKGEPDKKNKYDLAERLSEASSKLALLYQFTLLLNQSVAKPKTLDISTQTSRATRFPA